MCTLASFYPPVGAEYTIMFVCWTACRPIHWVNIIIVIRSLKLFAYYADELLAKFLDVHVQKINESNAADDWFWSNH